MAKKTIKLFGKHIILRGELESGNIILEGEEAQKTRKLKFFEVFLKGNEIENLEIGDKVDVLPIIRVTEVAKSVNPFQYTGEDYKSDDEFYILVNEEEIIGRF